ncbi:DUF1003 domain-containing protein [Candidatus Neptunichlamydia sp. REUL1]|uniref:DUF1003 domain-containing protein n=1 Tax=Candidatus Neptunichlamydia sp. REUL1 TaxID=3064277 RepID=UPI002930C18E|nr:DUF1003 domain-containing protein [Candidatus Neptunochlamydia sp. REUL1]
MTHHDKIGTCQICKHEFSYNNLFPINMIRNSILDVLQVERPNIDTNGFICYSDLREIRTEYIEKLIREDKGALSSFEKEVLDSLSSQDILAENVNKKFEKKLTIGQRMADRVARFGGSWKFILLFLALLLIWMVLNTFFVKDEGFDPYPFILLNLLLSCLAALQAPIIMMSQNRQAERDRLQANEEYCTNLKAELEIQHLQSKLDLFMKNQWESLLELQRIQIELTEDILLHKKQLHKKKGEG